MLYWGTVLMIKWKNNVFSCQNNNCKADNQIVALFIGCTVSIKTSKLCQKSAANKMYSTINKADFASSLGNTKAA